MYRITALAVAVVLFTACSEQGPVEPLTPGDLSASYLPGSVWLGGTSWDANGNYLVPAGGAGTICYDEPMPPGAGTEPEQCWFEGSDVKPWIGGTVCTYPQGTCAFAGYDLPLVEGRFVQEPYRVRAFPEPGCVFTGWSHGPTALEISATPGHVYLANFSCGAGGGFIWPGSYQ